MKKALLLAAVVAMIAGSAAVAQDSIIWVDVRDNSAGLQDILGTPTYPYTNGQGYGELAFAGGGPGDGQILRLNPVVSNGFELMTAFPNLDADDDASTGDLNVFMTVNDVCSASDVISSIGLDFNLNDDGIGGANRLGSVSFAWNAALFTMANAGKDNGAAVAGDPPGWADAKAVKVPVTSPGPIYDVTGGLVPGNTYLLGTLSVQAGTRTAGIADHAIHSTFEVRMAVDDLLITRVCDPGPAGDEDVSFGYVAGVAEATVNGSTAGATSVEPDALITVQMKADATGDGVVTGGDAGGFAPALIASTGLKQIEAYVWNADSNVVITGGDAGIFSPALLAPIP